MACQLPCRISLLRHVPLTFNPLFFSQSIIAKTQIALREGVIRYERDISRDPLKLNPQKLGNTPARFLFRRLSHAYEVWPLLGLMSFLFAILGVTTYHSFGKVEIWLDRSQKTAPWDWERIRTNYWKLPTVLFDSDNVTRRRLEVMEKLQDKMLEAAKMRGTRR